MGQLEFLKLVVQTLEAAGFHYMVVGSMVVRSPHALPPSLARAE
jgi:hypothetical protein